MLSDFNVPLQLSSLIAFSGKWFGYQITIIRYHVLRRCSGVWIAALLDIDQVILTFEAMVVSIRYRKRRFF